MSTIVIYSSKHDTTYSIAKHISIALNADVVNVDDFVANSLSHYDNVIVGGPIYGNSLHGELDVFCRNNLESLLAKKVGLFVSGLSSNVRKQQSLIKKAFLRPLIAHAKSIEFVGGAINLSKLSSAEKLIVRTKMKFNDNITAIDQPAIERLVDSLQTSNEQQNQYSAA